MRSAATRMTPAAVTRAARMFEETTAADLTPAPRRGRPSLEYWQANPDQRLGQVLHNVGAFPASDPYYVEDDDTEAALASAVRRLPSDGD